MSLVVGIEIQLIYNKYLYYAAHAHTGSSPRKIPSRRVDDGMAE